MEGSALIVIFIFLISTGWSHAIIFANIIIIKNTNDNSNSPISKCYNQINVKYV